MHDKTFSSTIEVVYPDGRHMTAWLGNTDVHSVGLPFQNTDDAEWHAQEAGKAEEQGQWMAYLTSGGSYSRSRTHCHYNTAPPGVGAGPYIYTEFEHRDLQSDKEDDDNSHKGLLLFRDWNGAIWKATVQDALPPFPKAPGFYLERQ